MTTLDDIEARLVIPTRIWAEGQPEADLRHLLKVARAAEDIVRLDWDAPDDEWWNAIAALRAALEAKP